MDNSLLRHFSCHRTWQCWVSPRSMATTERMTQGNSVAMFSVNQADYTVKPHYHSTIPEQLDHVYTQIPTPWLSVHISNLDILSVNGSTDN